MATTKEKETKVSEETTTQELETTEEKVVTETPEEEAIVEEGEKATTPETKEEEDKLPKSAKGRIARQGKKIERLEKELGESEKDRSLWREQVLKRDQESEAIKKSAEAKEKESEAEDPEPKQDDFEDWGDYYVKHSEWSRRQNQRSIDALKAELKAAEKKVAQSAQDREAQAQLAPGREKYEDFDEIIGQKIFTTPVSDAIMDSDFATDIAYYVGSNPDEATRLANLSPKALDREIGKLELKFSSSDKSEQSTETEKISQASEPITPVGASETTEQSIFDPKLSYKQYEKLRNEGKTT